MPHRIIANLTITLLIVKLGVACSVANVCVCVLFACVLYVRVHKCGERGIEMG
jgi:hypothetical protein